MNICDKCGHEKRKHLEEAETIFTVVTNSTGSMLIEESNPDYAPLEFHCTHDGCDCVIRYAAKHQVD